MVNTLFFRVIPDYQTTNQTLRAVATFIQSLAPLNSAANPLIYCLFSTNIGAALCNIFGCKKASRPNLSTGLTTSTNSQTKPLVGQTLSNVSRSMIQEPEEELKEPLHNTKC